MNPSNELLIFYQKKFLDLIENQKELIEKFEECKILSSEGSKLEKELQNKTKDISLLQNALSDVYLCLFQQKKFCSELEAENNSLKFKIIKDQIKIQFLLSLNGISTEEFELLINSTDQLPYVSQKLPLRLKNLLNKKYQDGVFTFPKEKLVNDISDLQLKSVETLFKEKMSLLEQHIQCLSEEIKLNKRERLLERNSLEEKNCLLSEQMNVVKDKLTELIQISSQQKVILCAKEMEWMEEKFCLTKTLEHYRNHFGILQSSNSGLVVMTNVQNHSEKCKVSYKDIQFMKGKLAEKDTLLSLYQEQCLSLEKEIVQLRENSVLLRKKSEDQAEKLREQVKYLQKKYADLDHRRCLDGEGFYNDIKILRDRLLSLEKKVPKSFNILKVTGPSQLIDSSETTSDKSYQLNKKLSSKLKTI